MIRSLREATPDSTASAVLCELARALSVKVTPRAAVRALESHPEHPSLGAIAATVGAWGVRADGYRLGPAKLAKIPFPAVAELRDGRFVLLLGLESDGGVRLYDPARGRRVESLERFSESWSGAVLVAAHDGTARDPAYAEERMRELRDVASVLGVALGLAALSVLMLVGAPLGLWLPVFLTKLAGAAIAGLLVAMEWSGGAFRPALCRVGARIDCALVLRSRAAKLPGGLGVAEAGALYFVLTATAIASAAALGAEIVRPMLGILAPLSAAAFAYGMRLLYEQAFRVRRFCALCLGIDGLLGIELAFGLAGPRLEPGSFGALLPAAIPVLVLLGTWLLARRALIRLFELRSTETELARLRRDPEVLAAVLARRPVRALGVAPLSVTFGDAPAVPATEPRLTAILSLSCSACRTSFPRLARLGARVLIAAPPPGADPIAERASLVLHQIAAKDPAAALPALERWFSAESAARWLDEHDEPTNLAGARERLDAHRAWTQSLGLQHVPTLLLDGREVPAFASIDAVSALLGSGRASPETGRLGTMVAVRTVGTERAEARLDRLQST